MKSLRSIGIVCLCVAGTNVLALELYLAEGSVTGPQAPGIMIDLTASQPEGIRVHSWDIYSSNSVPMPNVQLWYRVGSYVGHEMSSVGWTLHDEGEVESIPGGVLEPNYRLPIAPLDIMNGQTLGVYLVVSNHHPHTPFVAGIGVLSIPPALPTYTGTGLQLDGGTARGSISESPGDPFGTTLFPGYMLSGRLQYAPVPEPAAAAILLIGLAALAVRGRARG